jgi:glycine betaine catabolism B
MTIDKANNDMPRPVVVPTNQHDDWTGSARHTNLAFVREHLEDADIAEFFRSSPDSLMVQVKGILQQLRAGAEQVHQGQFVPRRVVREGRAEQPNGVIEFVKSGKFASLPANCSVLETAELNGIDIPYRCRRGHCGICATRLLAGDVRMDCEDGLNPALKAQGYVLTCIGRAQGNVRLDA